MNSAMFGGLVGIIGEVVNNGMGLIDANLKNKKKTIESREKMHEREVSSRENMYRAELDYKKAKLDTVATIVSPIANVLGFCVKELLVPRIKASQNVIEKENGSAVLEKLDEEVDK